MKITQETKRLHEERAKLVTEMQEIKKNAVENGGFSPEQSKKFDELDTLAEAKLADIKRIEKLHALSETEEEKLLKEKERSGKSVDEQKDIAEKQTKAFARYLLVGPQGLNEEERKILVRAQSEGTTTEGGYLVPQGFMAEYDAALLAHGGVRDVARTLRTAGGNDIPWPNTDDTANKSVILAENNAAGSSKDLVFGSTTLKSFVYSTDIIKVSKQLMQDSAINIPKLVGELLALRDARGTNYDFTLGVGTTDPKGVVTESTAGVTTAAEGSFTSNEIVDLEHSVNPEYRKNGTFMMNDAVLKAIKKLTFSTSDNRPLWEPAILKIGTPSTILGYKYVINQDMASSIVADAKVILFGDFSKYIVRDVLDYQVIVMNERYAEYLQVAFLGISRHDGRKIAKSTVYPWKHMVMVNT